MILVDADFLIGLYYDKDSHHEKCIDVSKNIKDSLIISWDVVDEVTTKLSYFVDKETSLRFLKTIEKEKIQIVYPDYNLFQKAKKIFANLSSKKVSLTDCMNMAIAKEKKITTILSFDKVYKKNGFTLYGETI